jgi:hypothetical protein
MCGGQNQAFGLLLVFRLRFSFESLGMSDDEATSNVIEVVMPTYIMRPDADEK